MKYNRPQATASWGTMAKDWERGIDYDRLHKARVKRVLKENEVIGALGVYRQEVRLFSDKQIARTVLLVARQAVACLEVSTRCRL